MKTQLNELKNKPKEELMKMLLETKAKLRELIFELESGKLKNVNEVKNAKKDIARILTFLNK